MSKYKNIETDLDRNAIGNALDGIREILNPLAKIEGQNNLTALLALMARCFALMGDEDIEQACLALENDPSNADAFFQLGFKLNAAQYPDMAAGLLSYAHKLLPDDSRILFELVASLEIQGLYDTALGYLQATGNQDFMSGYLLSFNTLMTGDIAGSKKIFSSLTADSVSAQKMVKRLHNIFARVQAVEGVTSLDKSDYRGWHFILTGGLLLHLPDPVKHKNGQYESLEDDESLCKEGIFRLCSIFELWKMNIPKILSFDNAESRRLGLAFSETLRIPEKTVLIPEEAGLFVVYDHSNVIREVIELVSTHKKGAQLYCHASQFNREYLAAPDFTNIMYSSIISPWDKHTIYPTRPELPEEAFQESDHELAKRIIASEIDKNNLRDLSDLLKLAEAGKEYAAGCMPGGTAREIQWYGRRY